MPASTSTPASTPMSSPSPLSSPAIPLPPLTLSPARIAQYIDEAQDSFHELLTLVSDARTPSSRNLHIESLPGHTNTAVKLLTTATLHGTIAEVAELYLHEGAAFAIDVAATQRLCELQRPSFQAPTKGTAIRYSQWKPPNRFVKPRDLVYLETMDSFVDSQGRKGWARCTKSIELVQVPPDNEESTIRANMFVSGMVLYETQVVGNLQCVALLHVDLNQVPAWIAKALLRRRAHNVELLDRLLRVQRHVLSEQAAQTSGSARSRQVMEAQAECQHEFEQQAPQNKNNNGEHNCTSCLAHIARWQPTFLCEFCGSAICKVCAAMVFYDPEHDVNRTCLCADCSADFRHQSSTTRLSRSGGPKTTMSTSSSRMEHSASLTSTSTSMTTDHQCKSCRVSTNRSLFHRAFQCDICAAPLCKTCAANVFYDPMNDLHRTCLCVECSAEFRMQPTTSNASSGSNESLGLSRSGLQGKSRPPRYDSDVPVLGDDNGMRFTDSGLRPFQPRRPTAKSATLPHEQELTMARLHRQASLPVQQQQQQYLQRQQEDFTVPFDRLQLSSSSSSSTPPRPRAGSSSIRSPARFDTISKPNLAATGPIKARRQVSMTAIETKRTTPKPVVRKVSADALCDLSYLNDFA